MGTMRKEAHDTNSLWPEKVGGEEDDFVLFWVHWPSQSSHSRDCGLCPKRSPNAQRAPTGSARTMHPTWRRAEFHASKYECCIYLSQVSTALFSITKCVFAFSCNSTSSEHMSDTPVIATAGQMLVLGSFVCLDCSITIWGRADIIHRVPPQLPTGEGKIMPQILHTVPQVATTACALRWLHSHPQTSSIHPDLEATCCCVSSLLCSLGFSLFSTVFQ